VSDCGRDCWAAIFSHLMYKPSEPLLPRPEFCQDAAFIAATLDIRLREALRGPARDHESHRGHSGGG
jgi:hypothetical protein